MQYSAGKTWVLPFLWMFFDLHHPPKRCCSPNTPPHDRRHYLMTVVLPAGLCVWHRYVSKASRHRPGHQIRQNSILWFVGYGIGPLEMSCCVWHHWIKDGKDKRPGFWFPQILIWSSIMGVPIPTWLWPTKAWIQDLWGVLWCLTPGLWRQIHGVQWVVRLGKRLLEPRPWPGLWIPLIPIRWIHSQGVREQVLSIKGLSWVGLGSGLSRRRCSVVFGTGL